MDTVQEFVINQSNNLIKYDLEQFFTILHTNYYSTIDISFMNYFLELVNKEGKFCVEQEKLQEYGVLSSIDTSNNIKRRFNTLNLIENDDYELLNVEQSRLNAQHGGSNGNKKTYLLTPYAFKLCLIRAKNSQIYANYYLLLEKVFKHFQDYQYLYQQKLLSQKDDKINILINEVKEQTNIILHQNSKLDNQISLITDQKDQINLLIQIANDTNKTVHEMKLTLVELTNLVRKLLSATTDLVYRFEKDQILQTKVLVLYYLESEEDNDNYLISLCYAQLNNLPASYKNTKTKTNEDIEYNFCKFDIINCVNENVITVQQIIKNFDVVNNKEKTLLVKKDNVKKLYDEINILIGEKKKQIFTKYINDNDKLKDEKDSLSKTIELDDNFNKSVVNNISDYLGNIIKGGRAKTKKLKQNLQELL